MVRAALIAAVGVIMCAAASCTRTVHHAAVPQRDVTFSALSDLFNGPWAQGVPTDPLDPDPQTPIEPDANAAADNGSAPATGDDTLNDGLKVKKRDNMPASGQPPAGAKGAPDPSNPILATIRQLESNNRYDAQAPGSSASGAYQILNEVWAGFGGYFRAADAPPPVQDTKAAQLIISALTPAEDVTRIPVIWYIGHVPSSSSREWDVVPAPYAGNVLTPRQYQSKWLKVYDQKYAASQGGGGDGG